VLIINEEEKKQKIVKTYNCWICKDDGFVEYEKKVNGRLYKHIAHCICEKGKEFAYDGSTCKHKSPYFIPSIASIFPEDWLKEEAENNKKISETKYEKTLFDKR
jgi:hypothetical protein